MECGEDGGGGSSVGARTWKIMKIMKNFASEWEGVIILNHQEEAKHAWGTIKKPKAFMHFVIKVEFEIHQYNFFY